MAYLRDFLDRWPPNGFGHAEGASAVETVAGYGEYLMGGCTAFEGGSNANQFQNTTCGHSKDFHRY